MENAKVELLYHEHREHDETRSGVRFSPMHHVCVEVWEWSASDASPDVVVLHKQVSIDGNQTIDERIVLDVYSDVYGIEHATAQREGIRVFDELVTAHPFFGAD